MVSALIAHEPLPFSTASYFLCGGRVVGEQSLPRRNYGSQKRHVSSCQKWGGVWGNEFPQVDLTAVVFFFHFK